MKKHTLLVVTSMLFVTGIASAADVAENWAKNCASCHGKDGSGNTVMGKKNGVKDYRDPKVQAEFSDAQAASAIKGGVVVGGKTRMKAFKDELTDEDIKALVAHIRSFKKK
jgi:mono/diheme cytochrome c family protein